MQAIEPETSGSSLPMRRAEPQRGGSTEIGRLASTADRWTAAAVLVITVVGLLLRLPAWGNSLFGDEVGTYSVVTGHSPGQIVHLLAGHSVDLTPPLYDLLAWATARFGSSPRALTFVPLVSGVATIPLTYLVGVRTIGRRAGILAAGLVALSPFAVFYSTEARAYAFVTALVLASTLALLRAVERGGWWWALYAALACAAMYTHYTAVFILAIQFGWAIAAHPGARRPLALATTAAAIGFAPWLPVVIENSRSFGTKVFEVLEPFTLRAVGHDLAHWTVGHPLLTLRNVPGRPAIGAILLGLGLAALGAVASRRGSARESAARRGATRLRSCLRGGAALPTLLALATPAGLVLYSVLRESVWDLRNLAVSTPGLALACSALIVAARPPVAAVAAALVLAGLGIGATEMLSSDRQRPDYAAAARFMIADGSERDPVAVIAAPTPGPLSALDAALAYAGQKGRVLLRIGSPSLAATLAAPPYALLPATPARDLAAQAVATGGDGKLFVVAPGAAPLGTLLAGRPVDARAALGPYFSSGTVGRIFASVFMPLSAFVRAVAPRYRAIETRIFGGVLRISVYVFDRR